MDTLKQEGDRTVFFAMAAASTHTTGPGPKAERQSGPFQPLMPQSSQSRGEGYWSVRTGAVRFAERQIRFFMLAM